MAELTKDQIEEMLSGKSPDEIMRMIQEAQSKLRTELQKEERAESKEIRAELEPLEKELEKLENSYLKLKAAYNEKINELRIKRDEALEIAAEKVEKVRESLNKKRIDLGLKTTRKSSLGKLLSWHLEIDPNNIQIVEIGLKNKPETYTKFEVSEEGKVKTEIVKEKLFIKHEIEDKTGGKLRGLLIRVKLAYISALDKKEK